MPVRVLQVVTQMNRDGLESRLMDIYRNIDRSKIQFDFYTFRLEKGQYDDEIISLGGKVYYNPPLSIMFLKRNAEFVKFLQERPEYKIVHAHMNAWCGLLLSGAKAAGVPVRIAHSRTSLDQLTLKNMVKNLIKLSVNKYATHRFAVSRKAGIWLFGEKAEKQGLVEVWPNAIECERFRYDPAVRQEMRRELGLEDHFVLMNVGNDRFEKNHSFLLKIFKEVRQKEPSALLVLVGRGDWDKVCTQAAQLGLADRVILTGSRSDVNRVLQAGDVFVFPSLYEGMPGAVLEAQAAGLSCLISDTITDEVCLTPLAVQLPLSLSAQQWAAHVLACKHADREDTLEYFQAKGFDINSLVNKITAFYLNAAPVN